MVSEKMRLSKKMKKILLVLWKYKQTEYEDGFTIERLAEEIYGKESILVDNPPFWISNLGRHRRNIRRSKVLKESLRISLQNSLQLLVKHEFLERDLHESPVKYRLKNKGSDLAFEIKNELVAYINEWRPLVREVETA
jgi:hypothetical protein